MTSTAQQLATLGWMVVTGLGVGLVFDLYRVFRGVVRPRWFVTAIGDLFFWLLVIVLTYGVLLWVNFGEVRSFVFFGFFFGLALYYRFGSPLVLRLFWRFIEIAHKALHLFFQVAKAVFLAPLLFLFGLFLSPIRWVGRPFRGFFSRSHRILKSFTKGRGKWLQQRGRQLYRLIKYKLIFLSKGKK